MVKLGTDEGIRLLKDMEMIVQDDRNILIAMPEIYERYGASRIDNFLYQVSIGGEHYQGFLRTRAGMIPEFGNFSMQVDDSQLKLTHEIAKEQNRFLQGVVIRIWYKNRTFSIDKESATKWAKKVPGEIEELRGDIELARSAFELNF